MNESDRDETITAARILLRQVDQLREASPRWGPSFYLHMEWDGCMFCRVTRASDRLREQLGQPPWTPKYSGLITWPEQESRT